MIEWTLRQHGVELDGDHESALCTPGTGIHLVLTNLDTNADEVGLVSCVLRALSSGGYIQGGWEYEKIPAGSYKTHFVLANVDCVIYPHGEPGREALRQLAVAFKELETQLNRALDLPRRIECKPGLADARAGNATCRTFGSGSDRRRGSYLYTLHRSILLPTTGTGASTRGGLPFALRCAQADESRLVCGRGALQLFDRGQPAAYYAAGS